MIKKMIKKIQLILKSSASIVESIIGIIVLLACIVGSASALLNPLNSSLFSNPAYFLEWINIIFYFIIGIELVKLLVTHCVEAVVDILMVALARQMLVGHPKPLDNLLIIIAVAVLFFVRKYLFISKKDELGDNEKK